MKNKCVIDVFDFGDDDRRKRGEASPSLNDHFEIRDRQEESESKKTVIQSISGMQKNARLLWWWNRRFLF